MDVRNCRQCGKLFSYTGKPICPDCARERESEFNTVKEFIRENPSCGIAAVAEATGTSVNQIRQWIREERLVLTSASEASGINCEGCGRPIQTGRLCQSCKNQVKRDLTKAYGSGTPAPSTGKDSGVGNSKGDRMRYLSKDNK